MLRRRPPPRSTLFPYTTLFRSVAVHGRLAVVALLTALAHAVAADGHLDTRRTRANAHPAGLDRRAVRRTTVTVDDRSEEHTSELQSRLHLVCRLLLEKKKTNKL